MDENPSVQKPAYTVTLNPDELAWFGLFNAVWSQIDFFTGMAIAGLLKTEFASATMFMDNMTTGPRINLMRRLIPRIEGDPHKILAKQFCTDMGGLIEKRNHLLHGMWGWTKPDGATEFVSACHYDKKNENPIFASEIPALYERAAKQTHVIVQVQAHIFKHPEMVSKPGAPAPSFFFGPGPPPGYRE